MHAHRQVAVALSLAFIACQGPDAASNRDTTRAPQRADSSTVVAGIREPGPRDSATALTAGREPGTTPAIPTPTVTSASSITAMRLHLQKLDSASLPDLQEAMSAHAKMLGDLLTTMGVEVQAVVAPAKNAWRALSDSVDADLDQLALGEGETLRVAFRAHRARVLRLLDGFRALIPAR